MQKFRVTSIDFSKLFNVLFKYSLNKGNFFKNMSFHDNENIIMILFFDNAGSVERDHDIDYDDWNDDRWRR